MPEYIEREKAIAEIKNYALEAYDIDLDDSKQFAGNSTGEKHCEGLYEATEILEEVPTTDVVEVVRCGQCGNYCKNTGECNLYGRHPNENDFCSSGIKEREGE